jgi:hypothetical protein
MTKEYVGMSEIYEGAVLWIDVAVCLLPEAPDGFALRVVDLLGWADPARQLVWVRGVVLDQRGVPCRFLNVCVPTDQPRAVPAHRAAPPTVGTAAVDQARHRASGNGMVGPPPGYQRRVV